MTEFPNPYQEPVLESPGVKYQHLADSASAYGTLLGLNLTEKGKTALAVLIQETEDWWRTSNNARDIQSILGLLHRLMNL